MKELGLGKGKQEGTEKRDAKFAGRWIRSRKGEVKSAHKIEGRQSLVRIQDNESWTGVETASRRT